MTFLLAVPNIIIQGTRMGASFSRFRCVLLPILRNFLNPQDLATGIRVLKKIYCQVVVRKSPTFSWSRYSYTQNNRQRQSVFTHLLKNKSFNLCKLVFRSSIWSKLVSSFRLCLILTIVHIEPELKEDFSFLTSGLFLILWWRYHGIVLSR